MCFVAVLAYKDLVVRFLETNPNNPAGLRRMGATHHWDGLKVMGFYDRDLGAIFTESLY